MDKAKSLAAIVTLVLLVAAVHSYLHIAVYGSGIEGLYKNGVSGFSIGNVDLEKEFKAKDPSFSKTSFGFMGIEWLVFITLVIFAIITKKIELTNESLNANVVKVYSNSSTNTDIDVLYEILKSSGAIKLSAAAKLFNVDKEKVIEWSKILESADLAVITYPRLSEPEISLKE